MKKSETWTADWGTDGGAGPLAVLNAIQHPVIMIDGNGHLAFANWEAESFFGASAAHLAKQSIETLVPFGSPLVALIDQVRERHAPINEYKVDLSSPRLGYDKLVDLYAAPVVNGPADNVVVVLQERSMADKIDRQLTHRGAARSVTGLASMLAHEIKNPLSGIRGAAQLLESSVGDEDRALARLIRDETDRIVSLVDRMEIFSDERPVDREPVNIHSVLDHVKSLAKAGFGRKIKFTELYDPSLPPVYANRDQLVQIFLNLVKYAAEAVPEEGGEITLTTAFQHGLRVQVPGSRDRLDLPLVVTVQDNGQGVPEDIRANLFDPFVTTKPSGTGLGLSLVAKAVNDHGGVIEVDSRPRRTVFKVMLPMYNPKA